MNSVSQKCFKYIHTFILKDYLKSLSTCEIVFQAWVHMVYKGLVFVNFVTTLYNIILSTIPYVIISKRHFLSSKFYCTIIAQFSKCSYVYGPKFQHTHTTQNGKEMMCNIIISINMVLVLAILFIVKFWTLNFLMITIYSMLWDRM